MLYVYAKFHKRPFSLFLPGNHGKGASAMEDHFLAGYDVNLPAWFLILTAPFFITFFPSDQSFIPFPFHIGLYLHNRK